MPQKCKPMKLSYIASQTIKLTLKIIYVPLQYSEELYLHMCLYIKDTATYMSQHEINNITV